MNEKDRLTTNPNIGLAEHCLKNFNLIHWPALLHEKVMLEFPYGPLMQMPGQVSGKAAAINFLEQEIGMNGSVTFRDVSVMPTADPATVIAEYAGPARVPSCEKQNQVFFAFMTFRDGRLILFREYPNRLQVFKAFGSSCPQA